jgi:mandelate racemase
LGLIGPDAVAEEARVLAEGFPAIKVRLGYDDERNDLVATEAALQAGCQVMSDYNQCLNVPEAVRRCRTLDRLGLLWIEEPVLATDYEGHAEVAREIATPVQLGENCWGPGDFAAAIRAKACDLAMADAVKIGGGSGWLRAASFAAVSGVPLSSHLYPEVSVHLLAVSPTAHWLEFVDFAAPILRNPLPIVDGFAQVPESAGIGLEWDEAAVQSYGVRI